MPESDDSIMNVPAVPRKPRFYRHPYFFSIASSTILISLVGCCFLSKFLMGFTQFDGATGANEVAARVIEWTPPKDFTGRQGVVFDNFAMEFDIAIYQHNEGRGVLVIAQLHWKSNSLEKNRAILQQFVEQLVPDLKKIDPAHSETRELSVHDKPAKFEISQGEDLASITKFRQVTAELQGKLDDAIIILQCEENYLTETEINDFIQSIK